MATMAGYFCSGTAEVPVPVPVPGCALLLSPQDICRLAGPLQLLIQFGIETACPPRTTILQLFQPWNPLECPAAILRILASLASLYCFPPFFLGGKCLGQGHL